MQQRTLFIQFCSEEVSLGLPPATATKCVVDFCEREKESFASGSTLGSHPQICSRKFFCKNLRNANACITSVALNGSNPHESTDSNLAGELCARHHLLVRPSPSETVRRPLPPLAMPTHVTSHRVNREFFRQTDNRKPVFSQAFFDCPPCPEARTHAGADFIFIDQCQRFQNHQRQLQMLGPLCGPFQRKVRSRPPLGQHPIKYVPASNLNTVQRLKTNGFGCGMNGSIMFQKNTEIK